MLLTKEKKKYFFLTFLFFYGCNVSPKSLDWIGQNHSFRISAYGGFRISSKHVAVFSAYLVFPAWREIFPLKYWGEPSKKRWRFLQRYFEELCEKKKGSFLSFFFSLKWRETEELNTLPDSQWKARVTWGDGLCYWHCSYLLQRVLLFVVEEQVKPSAGALANLRAIKCAEEVLLHNSRCQKKAAWRKPTAVIWCIVLGALQLGM